MAKKQQSVYEIKVLGLNDIKTLNTEIKKLNGKYDELKGAGKDAATSTEEFGKAANKSTSSLSKITKGAIQTTAAIVGFSTATRALSDVLRKGFKTFQNFEFGMAKVKAISGATDGEFKKLMASAKNLGRTTFFTASQVAELQLNLSKLGFRTDEILQSQEAILMLSTAMGEDLGRTATVVAASIRGFGESTDQTARFADAMAAAFANSALDIEKFQTSMTKVSAIAATAGFSFEETTGLLGLLTDRGIEASIAGTSLRNILLKLQDPTSDLSEKLGRTVHSGEDLIVALRELDASGIDVAGVMQIVDNRQVQAMESFIRSADAIEDFNKILNNSAGAGEAMADIMENTVLGGIKRMQSAYEGLVLAITTGSSSLSNVMQTGFDSIAKALNFYANALSNTEERTNIVIANIQSSAQKALSGKDSPFSSLSEALKSEQLILEGEIILYERTLEEMSNSIFQGVFTKNSKKRQENLEKDIEARKQAAIQLQNLINEQVKTEKEAAEKQEEIDRQNKKRLKEESKLQASLIQIQKDKLEQAQLLPESTEKEIISKNKIIRAIELEIKRLKELGVEKAKQNKKEKIIPDASIDEETQLQIQRSQDEARRQFNEGIIETEEALQAELLDIELKSIQQALEFKNLSVEDEIALNNRLAEVTIKNNKRIAKSEADKRKKQEDAVDSMKQTGQLLMQIGEQEGENSRIRQIGIKITQAAAVAEGLLALSRGLGSITKQGVSGDPFTAIVRVAAMAAQLASVIANLKALTGGGGQATEEPSGEMFEQGGLTKGGMFVGNSHANGGVKFRVGGRIMEAEGGEAIINKKSTSMFRPVLSAINSYNGNGVKFADGGLLNSGEKFAMGGELSSAQQLISGGMGTSKVVIVESDMTNVQNRISAIESQATF
jgi:TP901 family phage tail tape measure protein|tara:strand:+ start:1050 stop:3740 length:2691 start_codon:yes stop_codon:yes gene_type:complete